MKISANYTISGLRLVIIILVVYLISAGCNTNTTDVYIRVNQVGYLPGESMKAVLFSESRVRDKFSLISEPGGEEILVIRPSRIRGENWGHFSHYYELDFTRVSDTGRFFLKGKLSGTNSTVFTISTHAYGDYHEDLLGFMRQQRCGYNPFLDIECHQKDGKTMFGPMDDSTFVDVSGGWHDAGDQLKYLITSSYATAHMLKAAELFPDIFRDSLDYLGQPGRNGITDLLDEARWGLDWIIRMHPAPDQLFHQVADDRDHIGWKMPDNDRSDYGWGPNSYRVAYFADGKPQGLREFKSEANGVSNLAGRSAAALALAYNTWKENPEMSGYAEKCLESAISVYKLGRLREGYQQGNSYGAPYRYAEDTWADDMEWGAAELYRATGIKRYLDEAMEYAIKAGGASWHMLDTAIHYQYYPFVNIGHFVLYDLVDDNFRELLAGYYREGIEYAVKRAEKNPFNIGVPFIWCSNNLVTSLATQIILYERMTSDMTYHDFLNSQVDWLFGRNPWGTSMFTGIPEGGEYPVDVHTSVYALTGMEVSGGLVDGPVYLTIYRSLKGIALTDVDEFASVQNNYVVYHDDIGDYSTNEPTMDGTAGSIIMMAYLAGR